MQIFVVQNKIFQRGLRMLGKMGPSEADTDKAAVWFLIAFVFYIPLAFYYVFLLLLQLRLCRIAERGKYPVIFLVFETVAMVGRFIWCLLRAENATDPQAGVHRSVFSSVADLANFSALSVYLLSWSIIMYAGSSGESMTDVPRILLCFIGNVVVYALYLLFRIGAFSEVRAETGYVITLSVAHFALGILFVYMGSQLKSRLGNYGYLKETGKRVFRIGAIVCVFFMMQVVLWTLGTLTKDGTGLGEHVDDILYPWFYYPIPDVLCNGYILYFFTIAINKQMKNVNVSEKVYNSFDSTGNEQPYFRADDDPY